MTDCCGDSGPWDYETEWDGEETDEGPQEADLVGGDDDDDETDDCPNCGTGIYPGLNHCPHCNHWLGLGDLPGPVGPRRWLVAVVLIGTLAIALGVLSGL